MIAVVDTGGANLASVMNALERLEKKSVLTQDPETIRTASHVILPGVGAAADAMNRIESAGLVDCLRALKQPTLGICLGMQILFARSDEGDVPCLGIIPGTVKLLEPARALPIPHMGWNNIEDPTGPLFADLRATSYFYFVHSFVAPEGDWVNGRFEYGGRFTASVQRDNFFGVQFHPERSSVAGHKLLRNFLWL